MSCNNQAKYSSLKPDACDYGTAVRAFGDQQIFGDKYFNDNVFIKNLTVTGSQYIEHSKDLYIGDSLFTLNSGVVGSNTYDIGFIGDRGSDINAGMIWDESAGQFAFISTTGDGSVLGNVNISNYQDLKISHLYATGDVHLFIEQGVKFKDSGGVDRATLRMDAQSQLKLINNTNNNGGHIAFATKSGAVNSMKILSNGRVGIGTNNPSGVLHVDGDSYMQTGYVNLTGAWEQLRCASTKNCEYFTGNLFSHPLTGSLSGNQYLVYDSANEVWTPTDISSSAGPGGSNTNVQFNDGGALAGNAGLTYNKTSSTLSASGDIVAYASSDKRLKDNVENISDPILKLKRLNGVEFDWNSKAYDHLSGHDVGVLAQEVQSVIPEAVKIRDDGMLAVRYEKMIPLLIECIKDQQIQIDLLK